MPSPESRLSAFYLRGHLLGASGGLRLAQVVASDPWTGGALDHLPAELEDEIDVVRRWAGELSDGSERWVTPVLGLTATVRVLVSPLRLNRQRFGRVVALEAMRSLVLAKKAMWELGMEECVAPGGDPHRLRLLDEQAVRQARELQTLHRRAAAEAFAST